MVFLEPDAPGTRDFWSRYTIEFARRGLRLLGRLELHGPNPRPNDRVWGAARGRTRTKQEVGLRFLGSRGCADPHDVRGLRVSSQDGWRVVYFPVLHETKLSEELRQLIHRAQGDLLGNTELARIQRASGVPFPELDEGAPPDLEIAGGARRPGG